MAKLKILNVDDSRQHILLMGVRVSYPNLYREKSRGEQTFKRGATFMLDKEEDGKVIKTIQAEINKLLKDNKVKKLAGNRLCLRDGDNEGKERYEGQYIITSSSPRAIRVIKKGKKDVFVEEEDNEIYDGCYVNAKLSLWYQDNQYGKRVNSELIAVQFHGDGEPLAEGSVSDDTAIEGFEEFDDDDDDDFGFE